MVVSAFDLFSIGVGPSSSHTVGPMRAALTFAERLRDAGQHERVVRVRIDLLGSLGATGRGHASDRAVLMGLEGHRPESCDPDLLRDIEERVRADGMLWLLGTHPVSFDVDADLVLDGRRSLPFHPNAVVFTASDASGAVLAEETFYSVGGGFVVTEAEAGGSRSHEEVFVAHPFRTADDLLARCDETGLSIAEIAFENELAHRDGDAVRAGLRAIWDVMSGCIERGVSTPGVLPGRLRVPRRAHDLARQLADEAGSTDGLRGTDWLTLFAMAVNEENAAGGRVVTAPTNGAAGVIPAVLAYYRRFVPGADDEGIMTFLLTAAAIGSIYKETASISGAEVGCQGEVGSACSMAAAGFAAVLGGTPRQIENAAEIGMEHHLGMTCDPIGGLVQIPCIERNGVAAVKAVTAARTALRGDGTHIVSLDNVIQTMRQTGADMNDKYKETSRGGLAVNVVEC
ncbi:L-serine ammonia-lyase [Microbacterium trichothecenolyticum]|uniref:L-serine dehydratase n=1 Tax=Microbacterium trichothecenolyticum TaxID=69370 RepID=A0ABU0TYL5_MICTR|nr:L-serine ammonia-lyase [Microbacterium trichothecenolyticum]MDQ1124752.1 L-serine dehydratase [Microbacterium trichothecenolyticum]